MTYDDLAGHEFVHSEHGRLTVIEYNHAGQVFCYDTKGHYVIIQSDDPEFDKAEETFATEEEIEFIDFGEELLADIEARGIIIVVDENNDVSVKVKNLMPEDAKHIIRVLDDIFSDPFEGRYVAN